MLDSIETSGPKFETWQPLGTVAEQQHIGAVETFKMLALALSQIDHQNDTLSFQRSGSISGFCPLCGVYIPLDSRVRGNDGLMDCPGLYHVLGKLPEPKLTHSFCCATKIFNIIK